jgi:phage terminase large subunit
MNIKSNVVFEHLLDSNKKITVEQGGTRSGKTYNILMWIIFYYCTHNTGKTITICRKTFPSLRSSVMRDFISIIREYMIYDENDHNKSNSEYTLYGNLVEFISLDQPQKVRGRKRNLLYINEANELYFEDWQQLIFRTDEKAILDYNPSDDYSFIYDKIITRDDCDFFKTTYNDNPFLEQTIVDEIERLRETDEQYWQIYGLGERGISKATIFRYNEFDVLPDGAELIAHGMDFGYTNDPSTLVSVYRRDIDLYIIEHLYRTHMTTDDIDSFLRETQLHSKPIYADSAEPRLIDELRKRGHQIQKSTKGRDSVNAGIDLLKRYRINIQSNSMNAIDEFRNYKWITDKSGKITNTPTDKNNHIIDPIRYATYSILSRPNFGKYTIS